MPYTKTVWQSGDVISSEKLNKIEQGIEDASLDSGNSLKFVKDSEGSYEEDGETITYTGSVIEGMVSDDIPEEYRNKATGTFAHAEGGVEVYLEEEDNEYYPNIASGDASHAEGSGTTASGEASHAEGDTTTASGFASHAEGSSTIASGYTSHAEGDATTASGFASHAEGSSAIASGIYSHAEGYHTSANHKAQHVFGEYNIADPSTASSDNRGTYVEIVGNGTNTGQSNARTLDWSGNEVLSGTLTATGITIGSTSITEAQLQSLLALLNS